MDVRQVGAKPRPIEEPAPTMLAAGLAQGVPVWSESDQPSQTGPKPKEEWVEQRPSPTVAGDARIPATTRVGRNPEYVAGDTPPSHQTNAVRISVAEASVLQSFPPNYPWQGSRTKQFEQIGNAVPPLLARACLARLLG
jgi:DNA (cytosine-5)-methyltransferase 1